MTEATASGGEARTMRDSQRTAFELARLLRETFIPARKVLGDRWKRARDSELAGCLSPLAQTASSVPEFYRMLCDRFGLQPDDIDGAGHAVRVRLGASSALWWVAALARLDLPTVRRVLKRNPALFGSFATQYVEPDEEGILMDPGLFVGFADEAVRAGPAVDMSDTIEPRRLTTLITLRAPLAHGGDVKGSSNMTEARRELRYDSATGKRTEIPFLSGNAIRGVARDLLMYDLMDLVGVRPMEVEPNLAHALLSGGTVEAGASRTEVLPQLRQQVRELCPPWDLFGGNIHEQFMEGRLRCHDGVLLCEETAWLCPDMIMAPEERAKLPTVEGCMIMRQAVRKAHTDVRGNGGSNQMIFQTEAIAAGQHMLHTMSLVYVGEPPSLVASCLSRMIGLMARQGAMAGKTGSGFGDLSFRPYRWPDGSELPSDTEYLTHVGKHREDLRAWLTTGRLPGAELVLEAPDAEGPAPKKGKKK